MRTTPTQPPSTLGHAGKTLWRDLMREYVIADAEGLLLLGIAAAAADRAEGARRKLAADGICIRDRFSQLRAHPAARVEFAARAQMLTALKLLNLDPGPAARGGKPFGSPGRKE